MSRILHIATVTVLLCLCGTQSALADLKDLLGKLGGDSDAVDGITSIIGDIAGGDVKLKDLTGDWEYVAPAVSFRSDNLLKKAGGAAAAAKIEKEIEPYYQKAGFTSLKMKFNADSTFVMKVKRAELKGSVTKNKDGQYSFEFRALGKIKLGSMTAYMSQSGKNVKLTFDVSKLISLVEKISAISGNTSIKGLSTLLSSYDGLNAGFELKKTSE